MLPSNQTRRVREDRIRLLNGLVFLGFGLIAIGLFRLQVADHQKYLALSVENHVRLEVLRAPRGTIYDRKGVLLADSAPSFNIVYRPSPSRSVHRAQKLDSEWVARVAARVELDTNEVKRLVLQANASGLTAVLRRNAPFPVRANIEESHEELQGVAVQIEPLRRYPYGILAAHLLGYAGEISDVEIDSLSQNGYRPGDLIGRSGVERTFEEILRGQDGAEFVVVNAAGERVSTEEDLLLGGRPAFGNMTRFANSLMPKPRLPVSGHDLVLTVDLKVQQALEEAMANVDRGAAVAMDPRDGGILGLVSRPAFDPNEFSVGLSTERWRELSSGGANPLLNRAIQGVYPPGSTFKVVTFLAALRNGVVDVDTRLAPCFGHFSYGGRSFGCWKHEGHGSLDLIEALQHSCDVYFYQLGLKLGLPHLEETARDFGLGERSGIDLPQEKRGLIPSVAWYDRRWGPGKWRKGLLLNLAIGQGELLITPLQLAMMLGETAMNGRPLRPHVVQEVRGNREYRPPAPSRSQVEGSAEAWEALHQALEQVVNAGTATAARVPNLRIAGKTGTAQNPHGKDHALFACYAPAEAPTVALAFVVENSGHGGSIAAPLAGRVLARLFVPDSLQARVPPPRPVAPDTAEASHED